MGTDVAPDHDVFQRRHFGKQANVLKGAGNTGLGHGVHRCRLVGLAGQLEAATVRRVQAGQHIEESSLAGTVGANQAVNLPALDADADVAEGLQAPKSLGNAGDVEVLCLSC
jgi:hypothetical protein